MTGVALSAVLSSCSTGIEGTRAIKMSRDERRQAGPTPEDATAAMITSEGVSAWRKGKPFIIADDKAAVVLVASGSGAANERNPHLAGRRLSYEGYGLRPDAGGRRVAVLEFVDSVTSYYYNTNRVDSTISSMTGLDVPMLIDLDMVAKADSVLKGRKVWTKSGIWYDRNLSSLEGMKYVPVTITGVVPGNMIFPLRVLFADLRGMHASVYMNVSGANGIGAESRTYPALFSESDPKLRYPSISKEMWRLICEGKLALGMTKEECRLALGTPDDVVSGHDWDSLLDAWSYRNGAYLQFQDGLLVNFRR